MTRTPPPPGCAAKPPATGPSWATEKERDSLLERVGGFQRAEVERQVTEPGGLETGADLWAGGVELADLLDGEGDLDTEAIKAAKAKVLEEHPAWRQPSPNFVGGVRGVPEPTPVSFGEQLKRAAG